MARPGNRLAGPGVGGEGSVGVRHSATVCSRGRKGGLVIQAGKWLLAAGAAPPLAAARPSGRGRLRPPDLGIDDGPRLLPWRFAAAALQLGSCGATVALLVAAALPSRVVVLAVGAVLGVGIRGRLGFLDGGNELGMVGAWLVLPWAVARGLEEGWIWRRGRLAPLGAGSLPMAG